MKKVINFLRSTTHFLSIVYRHNNAFPMCYSTVQWNVQNSWTDDSCVPDTWWCGAKFFFRKTVLSGVQPSAPSTRPSRDC